MRTEQVDQKATSGPGCEARRRESKEHEECDRRSERDEKGSPESRGPKTLPLLVAACRARDKVLGHHRHGDPVAVRCVIQPRPCNLGDTRVAHEDPQGHLNADLVAQDKRPDTGVQFATAAQWVDRLAEHHAAGRLQDALRRLARYPLLVIDEVGYIPFEHEAANLFLQLVSSRYERAGLIVTSNKEFGRWGEVFGDDTVAAAMIDRLVHHADVIALKGDSYRLKNHNLGRIPPRSRPSNQPQRGPFSTDAKGFVIGRR